MVAQDGGVRRWPGPTCHFAVTQELIPSALRSRAYTRVTLALPTGTRLGVYEITAPRIPGATQCSCPRRDTLAQLCLEVYMRSILAVPLIVLVAVGSLVATPAGAQVIKETVPGITNYARVESTVACAGAITTGVVPEIKRMGYKSIINLRLASEPGANIEEAIVAAKAADITYFHIPFSPANPDPGAVDAFLKAIKTPGVEPAFIH